MSDDRPAAVAALDVPARARLSNYPEPFIGRVAGREKRQLGNFFGLRNFGVNLTRLPPGAQSSLMHSHSRQDELVYILEGEPVLMTGSGETPLRPGMCAGFPAQGEAHHIVNRSDRDVLMLEIGDRAEGDEVRYPLDDLRAVRAADGSWHFARKDGTPW